MLPSRAHSALQRLARFTSTMASPQKIIFHDLISTHEGPHPAAIGPNTWKARLALYHKGVDFELKYLTFSELRALAPKLGVERPRIPFIEFPDGKIISDSWNIAEWAEKEYPNKPSLWLPDSPTPVKDNDPALTLAKNYALTLCEGFGAWAPLFEISATGISDLMPGTTDTNPDKAYFQSDYKLGAKGAWQWLSSLDKGPLLDRAQKAVMAFEKVLAQTPFLCGQTPGFVDYIIYARYAMMRAACPKECRAVFLREDATPHLAKWVDRIEDKYAGAGLDEALKRMPPM